MKTPIIISAILFPVAVFAADVALPVETTQYQYCANSIERIYDANRELVSRMPQGEMIAGTVVATTNVNLSVSTDNLLKLVASVPLALAPNSKAYDNAAHDTIPAIRIEVKVNTAARFGYARSDADNRVISVYTPRYSLYTYPVGTSVLIGRNINQITIHGMDAEELKAYTGAITPDETRTATEDARASGRELAAHAKVAMLRRLYDAIESGAIVLNPAQIEELNSASGLSAKTQSQLLTQLKN